MELTKQAKLPKIRKKLGNVVPVAVKNAMARYREQYKRVYGSDPQWTWEPPYIRLKGQDGVTPKRLAEMTRNLALKDR